MDFATALGLTVDVWVDGRDREPIKECLVIAHALHWAPVLTRAIERNKEGKRCPRSFQELAEYLRRDPRNVYRWKAGQYAGTMSDFLALSMILEVPLSDFFPERSWWISRAASLLCRNNVAMENCVPYGHYCVARPRRSNPELDPEAFAKVVALDSSRTPDETENAILVTARGVGEELLKHGWTYPHRRPLS